jgi:hypothetical protein
MSAHDEEKDNDGARQHAANGHGFLLPVDLRF